MGNIIIKGSKQLKDKIEFDVIPDRIEAGTFMIATAMCKGKVRLNNINPSHLSIVIDKLIESGAVINIEDTSLTIEMKKRPNSVDMSTLIYPGFPTDLQAQYMAMMTLANGTASISERIFENRFMHVSELMRMGADIKVKGKTALIRGKDKLLPAQVMATDLRASVSLVLAALTAKGTTIVNRIYHLDRGYSSLEKKLGKCGAILERIKS